MGWRFKKRIKNYAIYLFTKWLIRFNRATSRSFSLKFCGLLGKLIYFLLREQRRKTLKGLKMAFGMGPKESKELAREVFFNLGRNAVDTLRRAGPRDFREGLVRVKGWERFKEAYRRGKGVVGLTAHLGNWELIAAWLSWKGYPITVVGRRLYDSRLDRLLVEYREQWKERNVTVSQGAKPLLATLKRGEVVGVLADRGGKGVRRGAFPLFGRKILIPLGPFLLAQKVGCPLVPLFIHLEKNFHLIEVGQPIEPAGELTTLVGRWVEILEEFIRRYPTHWAWMGANWLAN